MHELASRARQLTVALEQHAKGPMLPNCCHLSLRHFPFVRTFALIPLVRSVEILYANSTSSMIVWTVVFVAQPLMMQLSSRRPGERKTTFKNPHLPGGSDSVEPLQITFCSCDDRIIMWSVLVSVAGLEKGNVTYTLLIPGLWWIQQIPVLTSSLWIKCAHSGWILVITKLS